MTAISTPLQEFILVGCSAYDAHRYLVAHFRPTNAQAGRTLLVRVPVVDISLDREVEVRLTDLPSAAGDYVMEVQWAAKGGGPYPTFIGSLTCVPAEPPTSRLELQGAYTIPGGAVGKLFDAAIGHRIGTAAAQSLLRELASIVEAAHLHDRLTPPVTPSYPPTYE